MIETREGFFALLRQAEGNEPARLRIARRMAAAGFDAEARAIAEQALAAPEPLPEVNALAHRLLGAYVPPWHFALVRDRARNLAYEAAIKRAVRPGCRVLEIGAGTGLLAMMAARAGAAQVVSCEANPAVAAAAERIVAQNGFQDKVRIVAKHSDDLRIGEDLEGPADLLVSEIISNDLFAEMAIPALDSVRSRLLARNASVIPAQVSTRVALAEGPDPKWMGDEEGFDLSLFNIFYPASGSAGVGSGEVTLRSEPADLFTIDFQDPPFTGPDRAETGLRASGGRVNGIAQWLHMRMDAEHEYENPPLKGSRSCWGIVFHPLPKAIETRAGDRIAVCGAHDTATLDLWARNG
jgi:predicted nicotinamide N-methyase